MATMWISAVLLFLVKNAASEYDPGVCAILKESFGLIPPPLPTNFELKGGYVDHRQNFTSYVELYFDYVNSRAKYMNLVNTTEYHHLFDYDTQQVVEWIKVHPGVSMKKDPLSMICTATNMEEAPNSYVFGYQDWIYQHPKIFNSNEVLRFGGKFLYAANGSETLRERNLKVNKFIGCIYDDPTNSTQFNDYHFADTNVVQPSGGTPSSIVTGSDEAPLSVPVKLHVTGISYMGNVKLYFNRTTSISWFKGDPVFQPETFQIPPWVHCNDYRGTKDIPQLPKAFSTRLAITMYLVDSLGGLVEQESDASYEEIYYDSEKRLARRDFTPNQHLDKEIIRIFGSSSPVSTIYDFTEGVMFGINKASGRCFIRPISENDYFDTEQDLLYREIATPEELFHMQMDDMEYKGKAFARDIECDVWNGRHYHKNYNATLIKETYFSTDGWHELADEMVEYRVPVKHVMIKQNLDGNLAESVTALNFLKYRGKSPRLVSFDIKSCVEQMDHKRFAIELSLDSESEERIFKYKFDFLEAAQLYIANKTEVKSPLRVQRLHLRYLSDSDPRLFLVFSLLDKANFNTLPILVVPPGKDLEQAIILLQQLVESGKFVVVFNDPKTKEEITVPAERTSLYTLTPGGVLTNAPMFDEEKADDATTTESYTTEERDGMTGGQLAVLAFAMLLIGIGIGIVIMHLYLRFSTERIVEDRITMTETAVSVSEADGDDA